jgi:hypothetical protein
VHLTPELTQVERIESAERPEKGRDFKEFWRGLIPMW